MDNFGSFISLAAQIQGPIIGMTVVDYLIVKKRKISLRSLYQLDGHRAYEFTHGFNLVGLGCLLIAFVTNFLFVFDPLTQEIKSPLFLVLTSSGYTAVCGGLLYWLASLTPLRRYMLRDRDELDVV
jgi:NCS1 family nucleobase:cation symporter-1